MVNSLFIAALVLGFSFFGDLYQNFPLEKYLQKAHQLLVQFPRDAIAQRNASIISYLIAACDTYLEKRTAQNIDRQSAAVGSMFGQIHGHLDLTPTRTQQTTGTTAEPFGTSLSVNAQSIMASHITTSAEEFEQEQDQSEPVPGDESYNYDKNVDFAEIPCADPMPEAWWLESWDENMMLFSTVGTNELLHSPIENV